MNFAISLMILALCGGAQNTAKPAKAEAKADGAHCAMHASKEAGSTAEKACCAKHSTEAKTADGKATKAAHAECKHADGKSAEKGSCCAKHEKPAATAAAHSHAAAGASCNHDAKPADAAKAVVAAKPAADANSAASYVCPMHADITSATETNCSKCGMKLEKKS